jgi:hypothetical protein
MGDGGRFIEGGAVSGAEEMVKAALVIGRQNSGWGKGVWFRSGVIRVDLGNEAMVEGKFRLFPNQLCHSLGSDQVDLDRGRLKNITRKIERRSYGVSRPVDRGIEVSQKWFSKNSIISLKCSDDERGDVGEVQREVDSDIGEFLGSSIDGAIGKTDTKGGTEIHGAKTVLLDPSVRNKVPGSAGVNKKATG